MLAFRAFLSLAKLRNPSHDYKFFSDFIFQTIMLGRPTNEARAESSFLD